MFAYISGILTHKAPTHIIIETGGVGYHVNISLNTFSIIQNQEKTKIFTYLHVKEDGHSLYGFADEHEKQLFIHLISISGVGPNTARMILSSLKPDEVENAIISGNEKVLENIKGIGPKSAKRIILELKDKLSKITNISSSNISIPSHNTSKEEALSALVMLGFNRQIAEKAILKIVQNQQTNLNAEEIIRQSLKIL